MLNAITAYLSILFPNVNRRRQLVDDLDDYQPRHLAKGTARTTPGYAGQHRDWGTTLWEDGHTPEECVNGMCPIHFTRISA